MRNALTLLVIGVGQGVLSALYPRAAWLLAWSGLGFCAVAAAYARQTPRVFGKRMDGTLAWGPCVLLLPYLLLTWLLWYCQTRFSREAVCNEVAPGLWLGRRASLKELPPDVTLIVDLTSEFGGRAPCGRAAPTSACRRWITQPPTQRRTKTLCKRLLPGVGRFTSTVHWGMGVLP